MASSKDVCRLDFGGHLDFYSSSAMSAFRGFLPMVCSHQNRMLSMPPVCLVPESCTAGHVIVPSQLAKHFLQTLPCSTLGGKLRFFIVTHLFKCFKH